MYASVDISSGEIWRSTNGGKSYTRRTSLGEAGMPAQYLGDQGWYRDRVEFNTGPFTNSQRTTEVAYSVVDGNYFATLGIPIVAGRTFEATDVDTSPDVIVVNERFARRFWPTLDPIGQTVRIQGERTVRVVGVVADSTYSSMDEPVQSFMYFAVRQHERHLTSICAIGRTTGHPAAIIGEVLARTPVPAEDGANKLSAG